jgi:hypothetical protein
MYPQPPVLTDSAKQYSPGNLIANTLDAPLAIVDAAS